MKVSASLFTLLLALQATPGMTQPAHAQEAAAPDLQQEDRFDAQRLQADYRRVYTSGEGWPAYTAEEVTETSRALADGNQIRTRESGIRARDQHGRTRIAFKSYSGKERVFIADLKAGTAWLIRPERRDVLRLVGVPSASRIHGSLPGPTKAPEWSREVKTPLGIKEIGGIKAVGYLTETFFPPGARGNEKEMVETREYWHSRELTDIVYSRYSTPATGERITRYDNVKLGDVPESLFAIPADYAVRDIVFDTTPAPEPAQ